MENVIKRDGSTVPFDKNKIVVAIEKAMSDTNNGVDNILSNKIADEIAAKQQDTSVEEIQDMVESKLKLWDYTKLALFIWGYLKG